MNKLFFLHTHYIPHTILSECEIEGAVLVPEINPKLIPVYYGENKIFNNLEEAFEYINTRYNDIKLFFTLENLNILNDSKQIEEYKKYGLIMIQLYHNNDNKYFYYKSGLTDDGYKLLKVMEKHNIILDLSHLDDFWVEKVASNFHGKIVVSHCACKDAYTNRENRSNSLSAKTIELLGKRNALFGIPFLNDIISAQSYDPQENDSILMNDLINQIKMFIEKAGTASLALGPDFFDLDYFSRVFRVPLHIPNALFNEAGYTLIRNRLSNDGFCKDEIEAVFYKNALNFFEAVC